MNYMCADQGGAGCPCHLMEAGNCYTCTMVAKGYCSCEEMGGWQGTCPFSEYLQQGDVMQSGLRDQLESFPIISKISYTADLSVIRVAVSAGLAEQCSRPGAYMMAEALGWRTPLSILRSRYETEQGELQGSLEFMVKAAGPKTQALIRQAEEIGSWSMAGPYFNGLPGSEQLEKLPELIIARGVAAAPLIHMMDGAALQEDCILYLDDEGLPEAFLQEYLGSLPCRSVSLRVEAVQRQLRQLLQLRTEEKKLVLLLVSPYYTDLLCSGLSEIQKTLVIRPNPANLCCAMGLCGSCSHTDGDGVTVKLCKCSQTVIK